MALHLRIFRGKALSTAPSPRAEPRSKGCERESVANPSGTADLHDIDGSWRSVVQVHGGLRGGTLRSPWWARA